MKFDAILEYQATDLKLRRLYDEIEKSDMSKRLEEARTGFNAAKANVEECGRAAESLIGNVSSAEKLYSEAAEKLAQLTTEAENADEAALADIIGRLESLKSRVADLDKKLNDVKARADKAIRAYKESNERGKKMREIFTAAKAKLDALKKDKEPAVRALQQKLSELAQTVEPEQLRVYNELVGEGKVFAFVEAVPTEKDYSCRGCGLGLSQILKSELEEKGWCRCEQCRRVVYKVEKKK